ncbi:MAG: NifB/NifX family molybdenum-iron cluster-binding protein [Bacillota bacterium]
MRIAIATENKMVAPHFGRCQAYAIFDIEGKQIVARKTLVNPGHEPGLLPRLLAEGQVNVIIAGGMGPRARGLFSDQGIVTVVGAAGPIDSVIQSYLAGELQTGESACDHSDREPGDHCQH